MKLNYKPCQKCIEYGGKYIIFTNENQEDEAVKCQCYIEFLEKQKLYINLIDAGMNADFIFDYTLDKYLGKDAINIKDKALKYIHSFEDKFYNISLYLHGANGTQKSTISNYIGKELIKQGKTVRLLLMNDLINRLKDNFHKSKEDADDYDLWYEDILHCDLLIIDDSFDNKTLMYSSGYQITFLDTFLRSRLERINKSIIFTSNVSLDEIDEKKFSLSIKELVKRNCKGVFEMKDKVAELQNKFDIEDLWD